MPVIEQIFPSLTWRIRQQALYPDREMEYSKLDNDFNGIHFGLYHEHELTGVVSLFINGDIGRFRKLAILPQQQGNGFGQQLMQYLIDFAQLQKLTKLWCNARVDAREFYHKFGFTETDVIFIPRDAPNEFRWSLRHKHGIDFVVMELTM
jgi:N-acetylglutamate synthase-like GNAT family acetyltransferase